MDSTVGNFLFTRHYGACFCPFCLSRTASSLDKTVHLSVPSIHQVPPVHQATQCVFLLRAFNTMLVSCIHASFLFIKYRQFCRQQRACFCPSSTRLFTGQQSTWFCPFSSSSIASSQDLTGRVSVPEVPPVHWATQRCVHASFLFIKYRQFTRQHNVVFMHHFYSSCTTSSLGNTTFVSMHHFYSSCTTSSQDSRACFCPFYPSSSRLFISQHSMCVFVLSIHQVRPGHKTT